MKTLATVAAITLSAIAFNAWSQDGDKREKELDSEEVQSNQYRKINTDSSRQDQEETKDQVIEPNRDHGLGKDDDGNNLTNKNNTTQDGEKNNNAPAVIQTTSSESGSPAVLSGNNGEDRDGTNNVQRATPNMAGAKEPGNLNLSEKNYAPRNRNTGTEHKVRKQEEQPVQSQQSKKVDENQSLPQSQQQSNELREEVVIEQQPVQLSAKEQRKAKRQERRNRRRD